MDFEILTTLFLICGVLLAYWFVKDIINFLNGGKR